LVPVSVAGVSEHSLLHGSLPLLYAFNKLIRNLTGVTTKAESLLPYWLNYLGGEENFNKSMCLCAGANNWIPTQQALQGGAMNKWAQIDTPQAW
jgi:phospholipase C